MSKEDRVRQGTRVAVNQGTVAQAWRERGFSCALWVDPVGQIWADFVHDVDELVMVVEGDVEFEFGAKTHRPGAGQELLIPAGEKHTVRTLGPSGSRWLYGYRS
jgi:mannose-6-phosphate isomerase-like protein (cupin superfamily)